MKNGSQTHRAMDVPTELGSAPTGRQRSPTTFNRDCASSSKSGEVPTNPHDTRRLPLLSVGHSHQNSPAIEIAFPSLPVVNPQDTHSARTVPSFDSLPTSRLHSQSDSAHQTTSPNGQHVHAQVPETGNRFYPMYSMVATQGSGNNLMQLLPPHGSQRFNDGYMQSLQQHQQHVVSIGSQYNVAIHPHQTTNPHPQLRSSKLLFNSLADARAHLQERVLDPHDDDEEDGPPRSQAEKLELVEAVFESIQDMTQRKDNPENPQVWQRWGGLGKDEPWPLLPLASNAYYSVSQN
ncbi:hypothetical protein NX059_002385 [Plenodomus lindquistii]|nr:hypothetical protein NX059_002385 [Plenodomus lindquistii]